MQLAARVGGARETLTAALREFAIRQWQAPRCRGPASPRADLVTHYNRALCSLSPKACPYQLRVRDLTSSRTRPGATSAQRFWRTPEARAAMDGRVALVAPQTHARLLPAGGLRTWEEAADEYLRALRGWRPGPRERLAVALQKTIVLARILPATDGVLRTEAIDQCLAVLDDLDPGGVRPALWFSATRGLLHATRGVKGPDRQRLDTWIAGDPVLSLYAALKRGDL